MRLVKALGTVAVLSFSLSLLGAACSNGSEDTAKSTTSTAATKEQSNPGGSNAESPAKPGTATLVIDGDTHTYDIAGTDDAGCSKMSDTEISGGGVGTDGEESKITFNIDTENPLASIITTTGADGDPKFTATPNSITDVKIDGKNATGNAKFADVLSIDPEPEDGTFTIACG